jgi:hypothetical protein
MLSVRFTCNRLQLSVVSIVSAVAGGRILHKNTVRLKAKVGAGQFRRLAGQASCGEFRACSDAGEV